MHAMCAWTRFRDVAVSSLVAGYLALASCSDRELTRQAPGSGEVRDAVAHVNGEPIALSEVQALCATTGLSARAALDRLVAERLLAQYASLQGYGEMTAVAQGTRQAEVRALLAHEIEEPAAPSSRAVEQGVDAGSLNLADLEARRMKLERWIGELAKQTPVKYDEPAIQQALSSRTR